MTMEWKRSIYYQEISQQEERIVGDQNSVKVFSSLNSFCNQQSLTIKEAQKKHNSTTCDTTSVHTSQAQKGKSSKKNKSASHLGKRKRQQNRIRKSENQIQVLINEFKTNPEWTKERVTELSKFTGLSESQVYKWNWDQRKKFNQDFDQIDAEVTRDEFGGYCCKRWGKLEDFGLTEDDNICELLGLDVEQKALELVKGDLQKRLQSSIPDKMIVKASLILNQKKEYEQKNPSPTHTPKSLIKKDQKVQIHEKQDHNNKTPEVSNSKSNIDSCQTWVTTAQKSPIATFETTPFNILSPWKYDSQQVFGGMQNNFQIKTPQLFKHSPGKSPFKQISNAGWTLSSPYIDEKQHSGSNDGYYKSSCYLNFLSRGEQLNFSPGV